MKPRGLTQVLLLLALTSAIKFRVSPLQLYNLSGSHGQSRLISYVLASMDLGPTLWQLINHPKLDFRIFWDHSCDMISTHPIWNPELTASSLKFLTPHCLFNLRSVNLEAAEKILERDFPPPLLDLRSFQEVSLFRHDDKFAERAFVKAAFGYGPIFPNGRWCSGFRWRHGFPKEIWPLIDIECLENMTNVKRFGIPAVDLLTDYGTWSVFNSQSAPDYKMASFRFIHTSLLSHELLPLDKVKRWRTSIFNSLDRLAKRIPLLVICDDPWQKVFIELTGRSWSISYLVAELFPLLRSIDAQIDRSFQNRMVLYYMALSMSIHEPTQNDLSQCVAIFASLAHDPSTNPVHLSKFLEVTMQKPWNWAHIPLLLSFVLSVRRGLTLSESSHLEYPIHEIYLRQQSAHSRPTTILDQIPLSIRRQVALKYLRVINTASSADTPMFWVQLSRALDSAQASNFWNENGNHSLPITFSQLNAQSLEAMIGIKNKENLTKIVLGFSWVPAHEHFTNMKPVKDPEEACLISQSLLKHTLLGIDPRGYRYAYHSCFSANIDLKNRCMRKIWKIYLLLFAWECKVSQDMLVESYNFSGDFDSVNLSSWLSPIELLSSITVDG